MAEDKTSVLKLLQGSPFGALYPPKAAVDLPAIDGRTACLRVLRRYIAELTFHMPGDRGSANTRSFKIPLEKIHIEQPDKNVVLDFPSIVFLPGAGEALPIGLATFLEEESFNKFAPGTALQVQSEYQETFTIELWARDKPTRRAMMQLELALTPTEQQYGIRFRVPDYYDQTVCFSLQGSMRPDDPDNVRNRRWGHMTVEMRFDSVRLVNVGTIKPEVSVDAYDGPGNVPVGIELDD